MGLRGDRGWTLTFFCIIWNFYTFIIFRKKVISIFKKYKMKIEMRFDSFSLVAQTQSKSQNLKHLNPFHLLRVSSNFTSFEKPSVLEGILLFASDTNPTLTNEYQWWICLLAIDIRGELEQTTHTQKGEITAGLQELPEPWH